MKKVIDYAELTVKIQKYANENHNGNFTKAAKELIKKGLSNA